MAPMQRRARHVGWEVANMQLCEQGARARLRCRTLLREERAQAVVEMAVVTPVLIIVALIVYNVMLFTGVPVRRCRG